jgi:hypothetical protein
VNENNLIPFSERTESEQREIRAKGGRKSGETRRQKRDFKKLFEKCLALNVKVPEIQGISNQMGLPDDEQLTYDVAITLGIIRKAIDGDVGAFKAINDALDKGESAKERKLKKDIAKMSNPEKTEPKDNIFDKLTVEELRALANENSK